MLLPRALVGLALLTVTASACADDATDERSSTTEAVTDGAASSTAGDVEVESADFVVLDPAPDGLQITEVSPRQVVDPSSDGMRTIRTFSAVDTPDDNGDGDRRGLALIPVFEDEHRELVVERTVEVDDRTFDVVSDPGGGPMVAGRTVDGVAFALSGLGVELDELLALAPTVVSHDTQLGFADDDPPAGWVDTGTSFEAMGLFAAATGTSTPPFGASAVYGTVGDGRYVVASTWPVAGPDPASTARFGLSGEETTTIETVDGDVEALTGADETVSFVIWTARDRWIGLSGPPGSFDELVALAPSVRAATDEETAALVDRIVN